MKKRFFIDSRFLLSIFIGVAFCCASSATVNPPVLNAPQTLGFHSIQLTWMNTMTVPSLNTGGLLFILTFLSFTLLFNRHRKKLTFVMALIFCLMFLASPRASDGDFVYYKIYRSATPSVDLTSELIASGDPMDPVYLSSLAEFSTSSYTDEGLSPNETYYYRVYAFDNLSGYEGSNTEQGWTAEFPPTCSGLVPESDDYPDDGFVDENHDGIDGVICDGVFVAHSGSASGTGEIDDPLNSISTAIALADTFTPPKDVYIASGMYIEAAFDLPEGVSLYGGYDDSDFWSRSQSNPTTIIVGSDGIRLNGFTSETRLHLLTIQSQNAVVSGAGLYALRVLNCTSALELAQCILYAADGADGANGNPGNPGADGTTGIHGSPGCENGGSPYCSTCAKPSQGGGGIFTCGGTDVSGGDGGFPGLGNAGGVQGDPGANSGGDGGAGGSVGVAGSPGVPGDPANDGPDGSGGNGAGSYVNGFWVGMTGQNGGDGDAGTGGGGGGGGGGIVSGGCDYYGGSGGGGGSGGCGGTGGTGGTGGGASIGILLYNSSPIIRDMTIYTASGGDGGNGSFGGAGGSGGSGGSGGTGMNGSGDGGPGGDGGDGGNGGSGGGGSGGISYCIVRSGSSAPTIQNCTYFPGSGGNGGNGPAGNSGSAGASGSVY